MSSLTSRLGLIRWALSDKWRNQDLVDNWNAIDAAPGTHICTAATRPTWGANQAGRKILETDTGLEYRWSGSAWVTPAVIWSQTLRVRKVLSGRLTPPSKDWLPSPPERVLLDTGKGYREELTVDRVNHATGAVYVSRRAKS